MDGIYAGPYSTTFAVVLLSMVFVSVLPSMGVLWAALPSAEKRSRLYIWLAILALPALAFVYPKVLMALFPGMPSPGISTLVGPTYYKSTIYQFNLLLPIMTSVAAIFFTEGDRGQAFSKSLIVGLLSLAIAFSGIFIFPGPLQAPFTILAFLTIPVLSLMKSSNRKRKAVVTIATVAYALIVTIIHGCAPFHAEGRTLRRGETFFGGLFPWPDSLCF